MTDIGTQKAIRLIKELREILVWDDAANRGLLEDVSTPNLGSDMEDVAECLSDLRAKRLKRREARK